MVGAPRDAFLDGYALAAALAPKSSAADPSHDGSALISSLVPSLALALDDRMRALADPARKGEALRRWTSRARLDVDSRLEQCTDLRVSRLLAPLASAEARQTNAPRQRPSPRPRLGYQPPSGLAAHLARMRRAQPAGTAADRGAGRSLAARAMSATPDGPRREGLGANRLLGRADPEEAAAVLSLLELGGRSAPLTPLERLTVLAAAAMADDPVAACGQWLREAKHGSTQRGTELTELASMDETAPHQDDRCPE